MQVSEIEIVYKNSVPASKRLQVTKSSEVYEIVKHLFPEMEHRERMILLALNKSNKVLGSFVVSIGGVSGTICDPKLIFQVCLQSNASCFILAHNHPSGNLTPSKQDLNITRKLKLAGELLEIELLDHLIVTSEDYISMKDEGLI